MQAKQVKLKKMEATALLPIHKKIIELLEDENPCKLLDLPCGAGALSQYFVEKGFDVYSADINPSALKYKGLKFVQADLNQRIEYSDDQFDMCLCIEGIEHTFNPNNVIGEISRVLKPLGTLVLSTPNVCRLKNRLHYLFTGISDILEPAPLPVEDPYNFMLHISALPLPQLDFFCRKHGLEITNIYCAKPHKKSRLITSLFRPFLRHKLRKSYSRCRDKNALELVCRMENFMLSDEILSGEMLIIKAKKVA